MERLCDLLFELSNEVRLRILFKIEKASMKVTSMARELDITNQECSRHIARLVEAGLVEKDSDGFFNLTQFGRASLRLIPAWIFLSEHNEYFRTHSLEKIPSEFVSRIGEWKDSRLTKNPLITFNSVDSIVKGAEEFVWLIHDQYLLNTLPLFKAALMKGVRMRTFEPREKQPERILDPLRPDYIDEDDEKFFMESWKTGQVSTMFSEEIDVFMYLSEKQSILAFPLKEGKFDYLGFISSNPSMLGFCQDLFEYYWKKGSPLTLERGQRVLEFRKKFYHDKLD
jgi:predicted transcriptional regulator